MTLIAAAIPFFLLALVVEWILDRRRGTGYFNTPDALASLSAGAVSTTTGLLTKTIEIALYAGIIHWLSLPVMDFALFDFSLRGVLLWGAALLFWDFCYYWHHRLGHEVNLLWAAHVVHHQSEEYNLSTALRQTSSGFLFGWLFYIPLILVGIPVEVIATVAALDLIYQFWVHTRFVPALGWFDRVFVSPSNHRVHHAQNSRYLDKNYGGILIIWDRLFGTFQPELADEPCVYGVRKPLQNWNPVAANLQVYREIARNVSLSATWAERVSSVFRGPAWRPVAAGGPVQLDDKPLQTFTRYARSARSRLRPYLVAQFVLATLLTAWLSRSGGLLSVGNLLLGCGLLWTTLVLIALADNQHPWFARLEFARIAAVSCGGLIWAMLIGWYEFAWFWAAYGIGSSLFLWRSLHAYSQQQGESSNEI